MALPNQTMTNATVASVSGTMTNATVDASRLTPGTAARAFTVRDAAGNLTARFVALL